MMKLKIALIFYIVNAVCGQRRIMKGQDAVVGQFPYQVLLIGDKAQCGGSIIHKRWLLTAAHCVTDEVFTHISNLFVVIGTINADLTKSKLYEPETIIEHENFIATDYLLRNDIALIRLKVDIQFNKNVNFIKLPKNNSSTYANNEAVISGFGILRPKTSTSHSANTLQYISVKVEEQKKCDNFYKIIEASHLCTSTLGGKSTCSGDSGGPVVVGSIQIGIVSFSDGVCSKLGPNVHTRVSFYVSWIKEKLKLYNDELP